MLWGWASPIVSNASGLEFDDIVVLEGDEGASAAALPVTLANALDQPASVSFGSFPESATSEEDFVATMGRLVFVPGARSPGLPRPEDSIDPLIQSIELESSFGIDVLAELDRPLGLAFAPSGSSFGKDLYAASLGQSGAGVNDYIVRIDYRGQVEDFARLEPESDPTSLEFPPAGSRYGDFLFVSANNRDGQRPGDQGGTIQRIGVAGDVIDFSAIGIPFGPGEPGELAFGMGTAFGDSLLVANSVGSPGDILKVGLSGELEIVVDDGLFEADGLGLAPRSLAIAEPGVYDELLYFGEFGRRCSCLKTLHPDGRIETWLDTLPGDPHAIVFAPAGVFGGDLFVAVDDGMSGSILRVLPSGEYSVFAAGFQGFLHGNGKDLIEFSHDGSVMYVADYFADRIYRIAPASTLLVDIIGDRRPEADETLRVEFFDPINMELPDRSMQVTIENDDLGDLPPEVSIGPGIIVLEDSGPFTWSFSVEDDQTPLSSLVVGIEIEDPELALIRTVEPDTAAGEIHVLLEGQPDAYGTTELNLELEDEAGNRVLRTQTLELAAVNDPPVIDAIGTILVGPESSEVEIPLIGIGSGANNEDDALSVTVGVEGDEILPELTLKYQSPESRGSLIVSLPEVRTSEGDAFVELIVDDGADRLNEVRERFRLAYQATPQEVDAPPRVAIISPEPYMIFAPRADDSMVQTSVSVVVESFDDQGVKRIELFANHELVGVLANGVAEFEWRGVSSGDYELVAIAYDTIGQSAGSVPVSIAISPLGGNVAVVRDHDGVEIDRLSRFLFEIGFVPDVFWAHNLDPSLLSSYDLVVWSSSPSESRTLTEAQTDGVIEIFDSGIPFYFVGGGKGSEIPGLFSISVSEHEGLVTAPINPDGPESIVFGSYGNLDGKEVTVPSGWRIAEGGLGATIVELGGEVMMEVIPDPLQLDSGQTRVASQVFPVSDSANLENGRILKSLFQNTVCWLLRCASCHAVDLELTQVLGTVSESPQGQYRYEAAVRHSGECVGSSVSVIVPIPVGVGAVEFSSSRGIGRQLDEELVFELGRMSSSSSANIAWEFVYQEAGEFVVEATLFSSSQEANERNNQIVWQTIVDPMGPKNFGLRVRRSETGVFELGIVGVTGNSVEVEQSSNLSQWLPWGTVQVGEWELLDEISLKHQIFFRIQP